MQNMDYLLIFQAKMYLKYMHVLKTRIQIKNFVDAIPVVDLFQYFLNTIFFDLFSLDIDFQISLKCLIPFLSQCQI